MKMTAEELQEIRERAEKATAGPWEITRTDIGNDGFFLVPTGIKGADSFPVVDVDGGFAPMCEWHVSAIEGNAEFIAHAREDIPRLLAYIEYLEAQCKTS